LTDGFDLEMVDSETTGSSSQAITQGAGTYHGVVGGGGWAVMKLSFQAPFRHSKTSLTL